MTKERLAIEREFSQRVTMEFSAGPHNVKIAGKVDPQLVQAILGMQIQPAAIQAPTSTDTSEL